MGRPIKHAGWSIVYKAQILAEHPDLLDYLANIRRGLLLDLGDGTEAGISTAKVVLIDILMGKLSQASLIMIWLGKHGYLNRDALERKSLAPEPIVQTLLSLNNSIRADLQLLGLERRAAEVVKLDLAQFYTVNNVGTKPDEPNETEKPEGEDPAGDGSSGESLKGG
jgi:hypothetical protein